ncbi:MAG: hypothetical protein AB7P69_11670 [Candidatus Binatia bacterium]
MTSVVALGAALYGPFVVFDISRMKVSLDPYRLAFAFWLLASLIDTDHPTMTSIRLPGPMAN